MIRHLSIRRRSGKVTPCQSNAVERLRTVLQAVDQRLALSPGQPNTARASGSCATRPRRDSLQLQACSDVESTPSMGLDGRWNMAQLLWEPHARDLFKEASGAKRTRPGGAGPIGVLQRWLFLFHRTNPRLHGGNSDGPQSPTVSLSRSSGTARTPRHSALIMIFIHRASIPPPPVFFGDVQRGIHPLFAADCPAVRFGPCGRGHHFFAPREQQNKPWRVRLPHPSP